MNNTQNWNQILLNDTHLNQTMQLSDGRTLGYAEYGSKNGYPIFYFHGGNGSRFEAQWFAEAALRHNVRLIATDRPGFGLSDFKTNRQIRDWSTDVIELASKLHIDRFSIFGLSGGGPYVLALAHDVPDKIDRATVISGTAPRDAKERFRGMWFPVRLIFFMARNAPALNRFILKQMGAFYADAEQMRKTMIRGLPKPDIEFITRVPDAIEIFAADATESHRNGIDGDAYEWQLYVQDWGFNITDIHMQVALWYGQYDVQVPPSMGHYFAQTLPDNQFHLVEDGGHFSTINNHIDEIFTYLAS